MDESDAGSGRSRAAALRDELQSSLARWRQDLPKFDRPGSTWFLGIADRSIALTSDLLVEVTSTLMPDAALPTRPTIGQRIGLIREVGRKRRTVCLTPSRPLVSKADARALDRFAAVRNQLAHAEGQGLDPSEVGRYRPGRVAEVLDAVEAILDLTCVAETICVQNRPLAS